MTICERLFHELDSRNLTAYALSKFIGVNTTTTTNWKQRGTDPPAKYIAPSEYPTTDERCWSFTRSCRNGSSYS